MIGIKKPFFYLILLGLYLGSTANAEYKFYKKMNLQIPDVCPDYRYQQRLQLRNDRKLHEIRCPETGETLLSPYNNPKLKVYSEQGYLALVG